MQAHSGHSPPALAPRRSDSAWPPGAGGSRQLSAPRGWSLPPRPPAVGATGNYLAGADIVRASWTDGTPRGPQNSAAETPGTRGLGLQAGDLLPGQTRRGGGKTRRWPPASPPPPYCGVAPPLVAAAPLGAKRSGLQLHLGSLGSGPGSGPSSDAAGGGTPATSPLADAVPARAVRPQLSCQS